MLIPRYAAPVMPAVNCLHSDTVVIHANSGWPSTMRDLIDRREIDVLVMHEASVLKPQRPTAYFAHEPRLLHRLVTYTGRSIEAVPSLPLLTRDGWKPLASLTAADAVAIVVEYPKLFGRGDTDADLIKLLAYLCSSTAHGDGSIRAFVDPEVRADFERAVDAKGDSCETTVDVDGNRQLHVRGSHGARAKVVSYLELVGVHRATRSELFVPDFVFGLQRDKLRLFLNRIFTCDGQVESSGRVTLRTKSVRMSRQLQHLLARFGVISILRGFEVDGEITEIELAINTKNDVVRFIDHIGFFGEKAGRAEAVRAALYHVRVEDPELVPNGPILFDRVFSVEPTELAPGYGVVLPVQHNFVANDFVVRASHVSPQWADEPTPVA